MRLRCVLLIVSDAEQKDDDTEFKTTFITFYNLILRPEIDFIPIDKDLHGLRSIIKDMETNPGRYERISTSAYDLYYYIIIEYNNILLRIEY